jgi:hypothetical protein
MTIQTGMTLTPILAVATPAPAVGQTGAAARSNLTGPFIMSSQGAIK